MEVQSSKDKDEKTVWISPSLSHSAATALALLHSRGLLPQAREFLIPKTTMNWFISTLQTAGNEQFRAKDFNLALCLYTFAIDLCSVYKQPEGIVLLSNRAQTSLSLEKPDWAVQDAEAALKLDPNHAKSQARLKLAKEMLEKRNSESSRATEEKKPDGADSEKSVPGQSQSQKKKKKKKNKQQGSSVQEEKQNGSAAVNSDSAPEHASTCVICFERPVDHALIPCGHTFCGDCVTVLKEECAICRQKIIRALKIFL